MFTLGYFNSFKWFCPINGKSTKNCLSFRCNFMFLCSSLKLLKVLPAEITPKSSTTEKKLCLRRWKQRIKYTRISKINFTWANRFTKESIINQLRPVNLLYIQSISISLVITLFEETTYLLNNIVQQFLTMW